MKFTVKDWGSNWVEIFFEKERAAENGPKEYKQNIGTSTHLYLRLKKISCRVCVLFYYFFREKKNSFLKFLWPVLSSLHYWILLICLATVQNRSAWGKGFTVFLRLEGGLCETIVFSKAVPEVLNMKCRSEFKHGFTNCGCFLCAIVKVFKFV